MRNGTHPHAAAYLTHPPTTATHSLPSPQVSINDPVVQRAVADLLAADAARTAVGATFNLATCGWVLGPLGNRSYLDGVLPGYWSLSSIDQEVGK